MSTKSFYGMGQGSFYGGGMYGNGQPPVGFIEKELGPAPIVSFNDGLKNKPLKECIVNINPIQDLHGYDSPWPDGGGKNKLKLLTSESTTSNGVTFTVNVDGTVSTSGTATGVAVFRHYMSYSDLPSGESLILNGCPTGGDVYSKYCIMLTNSSGVGIRPGGGDIGSGIEYTPEQLANLAQLQIIIRTGINANNMIFKPMIRLASVEDDSYAPYSNICPIAGWTGANIYVSLTDDPADGTTYSVIFPIEAGTVYGGTLDVTNGVLMVDTVFRSLDGSEAWMRVTGMYFSLRIGNYGDVIDRSSVCSHFRDALIQSGSTTIGQCIINSQISGGTAQLFIRPEDVSSMTMDNFMTLEDFKAWLAAQAGSGTPVQVAYKLTNPTIYTLTPQQITTLLGTNNIWADTGDITIKYLAKK